MNDRGVASVILNWFEKAYTKTGRDAGGFLPLLERSINGDKDAALVIELLVPHAWEEARKTRSERNRRRGGRPRKTLERWLMRDMVEQYVAAGHSKLRASEFVAKELNKRLPQRERKVTPAAVRDAYYKTPKATSIADLFAMSLRSEPLLPELRDVDLNESLKEK